MNTNSRFWAMLGFIVLVPWSLCAAQNMVQAPGFESTSLPTCDNSPSSHSIDILFAWAYPAQNEAGDYLHTGAGTLSCVGQTPLPRTGSAHAGVVMGTIGTPTLRSYIEGLVLNPGLITGHKYLIEFYVRRIGTSVPTTVGAHISAATIQNANGLVPQVTRTLTDQTGYVKASNVYTSTFTATTTHITLGVFDNGAVATPPRYIFIDDVSVVDCANLGAITQQATDQVLVYGQDVSFSIQTSGPSITGYRWQRLDPTPVDLDDDDEDGYAYSGTDTPTLTIKNADYCDVGVYACNVSYACGTMSSQSVALDCVDVPEITSQPVNVLVDVGDPVTFTAGVFPLVPPCYGYTYHWHNISKFFSLADGGGVSGSSTSTLHLDPTVPGQAGYYVCEVVSACGSTFSQPVRLQFNKVVHSDKKIIHTTAVRDNLPKIDRVLLMQNTPNPFNPETEIHFAVPREMDVALTVFDSSGRRIRRLVEGRRSGSVWQTVTWNGRSDAGEPVASGIYFCQLKADGVVFTKKMVLLK